MHTHAPLRVLQSAGNKTFAQLSGGTSGKFKGSWADTAFNFDTSFPSLQLDLLFAAKMFAIDVYSVRTGGYIRRDTISRFLLVFCLSDVIGLIAPAISAIQDLCIYM